MIHEDAYPEGDVEPTRLETTVGPPASVRAVYPKARGEHGAAEADQTGADGDQTSSDSDQTASESDDALADADQYSSNRDQAMADRERATWRPHDERSRAYEVSRAERMAGTLSRRQTSDRREQTAIERLERSAERDARAHLRDVSAGERDSAADEIDLAFLAMAEEPAEEAASAAESFARANAAAVRQRAAAARARAAAERVRAAADRASAAEDRAAAVAELRAATAHHGEEIGQLAGGIAHDFNNLMAIVLGYANHAFRVSDTGGVRDDLEQIVLAADRATAITTQLLEFAGLASSGQSAPEPSRVLDELEPKLKELIGPSVTLDIQLDPRGPTPLIDGGHFRRIITSLVLNARDALAGAGTITVLSARRTITEHPGAEGGMAPGAYVEVSVRDTGTGIAADVLERAFEPFFTTRGPSHAGLGLSTVRSVVDAAGGSVEIQSELGAGTTVRVTLPSAPATPLGG